MTTSPHGEAERIGSRILKLIDDRRTTEAALAKAAGIPDTTLRRKLHERRWTLTVDDVANIAKALDLKFSELVRE